jgi:dTMP kinase
MFVTFEGIEGSGKSTQARRLAAFLGPDTVLSQEPGGTLLGKGIRELLLDHRYEGMASPAEVLLFFADRAEHVARVIRPALGAGRAVVSDRYTDSSIAYQGYGRGLSLTLLRAVAELATGGLKPDLTFFLDVPVVTGLGRVGKRGVQDRLEAEVEEFHQRVRSGYLELVAQEPDRWVRVDGQGSPEEVTAALLAAARGRGLGIEHGLR